MQFSTSITQTPVNTLVIEDQTMFRELLVWACQSTYPDSEIHQAFDGESTLKECREALPDLIILDLELPDCDGIDLLPELRQIVPEAKIVVLSAHTDEVTVDRVVHAPVEGFVDKNSQPLDTLREAVRVVMSDETYLSPVVREVVKKMGNSANSFNKLLSDREQHVLGLIGLGMTNGDIADHLGIRVVTAQNHRCNIMSKLDIHSTSHLIKYAREKGFTRLHAGGHNDV